MTMSYDTYGLPTGGMDVGTGQGWLPYLNQQDQLLASLYGMQGGMGQSLLNTLTNLITSPTSGPLGLAATSQFGNPQGIAAGTGGKGLDNSQYTSVFDALLKGLSQSVMNPGSPFNPENNGQYNTDAAKPVDPNKAPALTPEAAASAPGSNAMQSAWDAFHPAGQSAEQSGAIGGIGNDIWQSLMPKGALGGGLLGIPGFEDGGLLALANAADAAKLQGQAREDWTTKLQRINQIGQHIKSLANSPNAGESQWIADHLKGMASANGITGNNFLGQGAKIGDITTWNPQMIRMALLGANQLYMNDQAPWGQDPRAAGHEMPPPPAPVASQLPTPGYKDGGVTVGGEPHFITDSSGNTVARITEDGQPEHVGGVGGVEVTPMDPLRKMLYESRKAATPGGRPGPSTDVPPPVNPVSTAYGKMLSDMDTEMKAARPGFVTGGDVLFPKIPGSQVNTDDGPAGTSRQIPTFGGTTERNVTPGFSSSGDSLSDMMKSINEITGSSYNERYAKLLGGALGQNHAIPEEQLNSLNSGLAPNQLFSSQALSTMSPSQRQGYAAMLQQMGIIQSPADLDYYVKQFTPTALG